MSERQFVHGIGVGDIVVSSYYYGWECRLVKFYLIKKLTNKSVVLSELESVTEYASSPVYYDTPRFSYPTNREIGKQITRRLANDGVIGAKTDDYWRITKVYLGDKEEEWNLH